MRECNYQVINSPIYPDWPDCVALGFPQVLSVNKHLSHHHGAALRQIAKEKTEVADRIIDDEDYSACAPENIAFIRFMQKLTRTLQSMVKPDIQALRDAGFADEAIVHRTEITGYFNYVNRQALVLGAELED